VRRAWSPLRATTTPDTGGHPFDIGPAMFALVGHLKFSINIRSAPLLTSLL
jgi:hypothetical protein